MPLVLLFVLFLFVLLDFVLVLHFLFLLLPFLPPLPFPSPKLPPPLPPPLPQIHVFSQQHRGFLALLMHHNHCKRPPCILYTISIQHEFFHLFLFLLPNLLPPLLLILSFLILLFCFLLYLPIQMFSHIFHIWLQKKK